MITQNIFNKKKKTFMDYEPGKVPSKKEWDTQTTTQTEAYDPFVSDTKMVDDNATKKDYDAFLDGFNDPYGEKREQEQLREAQEQKERLANIHANVDNHTWLSQNTTDPFLEGFNKDLNEREQGVLFSNRQMHNTKPMFSNVQHQAKSQSSDLRFPNTQFHASTKNDAFLEGFNNPDGKKKTAGEILKSFASEATQDVGAHINLHNIAYDQYPWMRYAGVVPSIPIKGRITSSSAKVSKYKDIINDVANQYNVPRELIGGIIFKEQMTKSLPDTLANVDAFIRNNAKHSTGLGAIFPATARDAWHEVDAKKELPETDAELLYKLTHDRQFNIETIAAVLLYEAKNNGIISEIDDVPNLTADQWWKAVVEYNGSDEYARKVYEYLPHITELLD